MKNSKRLLMIGLFITWVGVVFVVSDSVAEPNVYYGDVVAAEGKTMQVRGKDGRVSLFWVGRRTRFDTHAPLPGDKVKIEYVKDKLRRNAVTRLTILSK
jgi:hypothetical protein